MSRNIKNKNKFYSIFIQKYTVEKSGGQNQYLDPREYKLIDYRDFNMCT